MSAGRSRYYVEGTGAPPLNGRDTSLQDSPVGPPFDRASIGEPDIVIAVVRACDPGPAWWYAHGVIATNPAVAANDFAAASVGQVKHAFGFDLPP